ncbi:MAG: hypothetical protein AAGF73_09940 [Actinomycetota bacterium]
MPLLVGAICVLLISAACSSDSDPLAEQRASELVDRAAEAGVAPGLTVETAEALYGTDAPAFCEAHRGDLDGVAGLVVVGNTAQGRRPVITDEAITFGRLVAEVYCPDVLDDYDAFVGDVDPFERTDRGGA